MKDNMSKSSPAKKMDVKQSLFWCEFLLTFFLFFLEEEAPHCTEEYSPLFPKLDLSYLP